MTLWAWTLLFSQEVHVSTQQFLSSFKLDDLAYYEYVKTLNDQQIEYRLAALTHLKKRFLDTARNDTYVFVTNCIHICQHVLIENASRTGLTLSVHDVVAIELKVRTDYPLVNGFGYTSIGSSVDDRPALEQPIADHEPLGQASA